MKRLMPVVATVMISASALAQSNVVSTGGAVISVSGVAELKVNNDQAIATFYVEEQDKDRAAAASRVNQKMNAGMDVIKKEDPQAVLTTRSYYTYPVYANDSLSSGVRKQQVLTGWRVGQYLDVKTENLKQLPVMTAAAQKVLALNGLNFGLSDAGNKKYEAARLEAGYKNLMDRVAVIAKAMGKHESDLTLENVDFDPSEMVVGRPMPRMAMAAMKTSSDAVEAPNFEPGETSMAIHVLGKFKVK
jgi:uncharacterized protein YggE